MKKKEEFDEEIPSDNIQKSDNVQKKAKLIVITGTVIIVAVIITLTVYAGLHAYQKPVSDVIRGVNKADTLMLMESIYPEDMVMVRRINKKNGGTAWKDYLDTNDKYIEEKLDSMGFKKAKCKITAKEKLDGSNFADIKSFYEREYEADVKKAYRVEVSMTFKTKGGNETPSGWICVVKLKDEGWKFCPEFSEKHFDFIDEAINFQ